MLLGLKSGKAKLFPTIRGWLERPYTIEEIKSAVFALLTDKAPGLDGSSVAFYQECCETIKDDLPSFFMDFLSHGKILKGINATFLTLLPKKTEAYTPQDFCPISLISRVYKNLAKVLSNRIKETLHEAIDGNTLLLSRIET